MNSLKWFSMAMALGLCLTAGIAEAQQREYWYEIQIVRGDEPYSYYGTSIYAESELRQQIARNQFVTLDKLHFFELDAETKQWAPRSWTDYFPAAIPRIHINPKSIVTFIPLNGDPRDEAGMATESSSEQPSRAASEQEVQRIDTTPAINVALKPEAEDVFVVTESLDEFRDRGERLLQEGKYAELAAIAENHIDTIPGDAYAYYLAGMAHYRMTDLGQAVHLLEKASQLSPDLLGVTEPYITAAREILAKRDRSEDTVEF